MNESSQTTPSSLENSCMDNSGRTTQAEKESSTPLMQLELGIVTSKRPRSTRAMRIWKTFQQRSCNTLQTLRNNYVKACSWSSNSLFDTSKNFGSNMFSLVSLKVLFFDVRMEITSTHSKGVNFISTLTPSLRVSRRVRGDWLVLSVLSSASNQQTDLSSPWVVDLVIHFAMRYGPTNPLILIVGVLWKLKNFLNPESHGTQDS